jgi:hypothetical protein
LAQCRLVGTNPYLRSQCRGPAHRFGGLRESSIASLPRSVNSGSEFLKLRWRDCGPSEMSSVRWQQNSRQTHARTPRPRLLLEVIKERCSTPPPHRLAADCLQLLPASFVARRASHTAARARSKQADYDVVAYCRVPGKRTAVGAVVECRNEVERAWIKLACANAGGTVLQCDYRAWLCAVARVGVNTLVGAGPYMGCV